MLELAYPHVLKLDPSIIQHVLSLHDFLNLDGHSWLTTLVDNQHTAQVAEQDEDEVPDPQTLEDPELG